MFENKMKDIGIITISLQYDNLGVITSVNRQILKELHFQSDKDLIG
jgi:hypothetical protein